MMKKDISLWQFAGFALSSLGGTVLHFLYEWTGENRFIAAFSAVNESTWEHMKLLYFPLFVFALVQSRFFKDYRNFWTVKFIGISAGLTAIPVLFYTYNGVFGKSPDILNIAFFFVSAGVAFILEGYFLKRNNIKTNYSKVAFVLICIIGLMFVVFTFFTPKLPIFLDPLTCNYGIIGY